MRLQTTTARRFAGGVAGASSSPVTPAAGFTWAPPTAADSAVHPPERVFAAGLRHHHIANTAFPIAHALTVKPYRVPRHDSGAVREALRGAYGGLSELGLYLHVPFCETRCQFCEYTVVDPKKCEYDAKGAYFGALQGELRMYSELLGARKRLVGLDIGGGTPSAVDAAHIGRLMDTVRSRFELPDAVTVSIETTPRIASREPAKLAAYRAMGISRISMGLQTTDLALARVLGREDEGSVHRAVENVRAAGFASFNIDLMYGFPLRAGAPDKWAETVAGTIGLGPEHITLYRMRYKGTRMAAQQGRVSLAQVNAQEAVARELLSAAGYASWIGKNTFSRVPGDSGCSDYLDKRVQAGLPYIGMGLGAQSFSPHTLGLNLGAAAKRLQTYVQSVQLDRLPLQDMYHLSRPAAAAKFCAVSFYYGGIDAGHFADRFGVRLEDVYGPAIDLLTSRGLAVWRGHRLAMTTAGKASFGGVVALFYSPSVQAHLMGLGGGEPDPALWPVGFDYAAAFATRHAITGTPATVQHGAGADAGGSVLSPGGGGVRPMVAASPPAVAALAARARVAPQPPHAGGAARAAALHTAAAACGGATLEAGRPAAVAAVARVDDEGADYPGRFAFGNILFAGRCNQKCPFCVGRMLSPALSPSNLRAWPLPGLPAFVRRLAATGTTRVICTGTTTDPLLYSHLGPLLQALRTSVPRAHVSLHTNGVLAAARAELFNSFDTVTLSLNSFERGVYSELHGVRSMPDITRIMRLARVPVKLSCVLTPANSAPADVRAYVDAARRLGVTRIAFRHVHDATAPHDGAAAAAADASGARLFGDAAPLRAHAGNPVYDLGGVEVTHWRFEGTTGRSLNLFADGSLSADYLLARAPGARRA